MLVSYDKLIAIRAEKSRSNVSGQLDMFSTVLGSAHAAPKFEYPQIPEYPIKERLLMEKECAGMYFSGHLIDSFSENVAHLSPMSISSCLDADSVKEKQRVSVCGIVSSVTVKATKKKERMAFIMLEDRYAEIECLVFPAKYHQFFELVREDAPLCIEGVISLREEEQPKILVNSITELVENGRFDSHKARKPMVTPCAHAQSRPETAPRTPAYSKLYLRVHDFKCQEFLQAQSIINTSQGSVKVIFYDSSSSSYHDSGKMVRITVPMMDKLIDVLGADNVVIK